MDEDWIERASGELIGLRGRDGGWGHRRGASSLAEPTALAALALLAVGEDASRLRAASDWLASHRRPDGSVAIAEGIASPGWMTPHALLLWKAMSPGEDFGDGRIGAAAAWLLRERGRSLDRSDDPGKIVGHDTRLVGWPWVDGTHSWLEPTAMAVLALARVGLADHPRVREGVRLIVDRAVASGGWNYGNKAVFGRPLRPQPAPTGLALLALAATGRRSETVDRAARYLLGALPGTRAPISLGWGLLGLRAWGESPRESGGWMAESFAGASGRDDAAPRLAALLLAVAGRSLELLGIVPTDTRMVNGLMADDRWPMADGRWPMADGRWPMTDGRWPMADKA